MNYSFSLKKQSSNEKYLLIFILIALIFVVITITQDFIRAQIHHSSFYFSEALIFSSFWWLFVPFYYTQHKITGNIKLQHFFKQALLILLLALIHLFAFPILVWIISGLFYYHTYSIKQTLHYTLSEYLYLLPVAYAIPALWYNQLQKKTIMQDNSNYPHTSSNKFEELLTVTDGNKHLQVVINDILYFTSNSPYINIHLANKKYLVNHTLKSISAKLNNEKFIRIHRSTIINIQQVQFYTSRLNGDYDITMKNDIKLRLSRNFASIFKTKYKTTHPYTVN